MLTACDCPSFSALEAEKHPRRPLLGPAGFKAAREPGLSGTTGLQGCFPAACPQSAAVTCQHRHSSSQSPACPRCRKLAPVWEAWATAPHTRQLSPPCKEHAAPTVARWVGKAAEQPPRWSRGRRRCPFTQEHNRVTPAVV